MELLGKNIVGGSFVSQSEEAFAGVDPRTGESLSPQFFEAHENEIDLALDLAEEVFQTYGKTSPEQRAEFLDAIAEEVMELGEALLERASLETALPIPRLTGERGRTCNQLRMFAELVREGSWVDARIDTADPTREPIPKPDTRRMLQPLGPVVVFGVSNFPLAFSAAGGDSASALAAGCPVVLKAHPSHPGTSEMVTRALLKAAEKTGIPPGVFSMIHGVSHEVGLRLVTHPHTQAVGFTGSFQGGKALFDAAMRRQRPIPFYAEMGSINPIFLLPTVLEERLDAFVSGYLGSLTLGVGQFCTNPGLLVGIEGEGWENLLEKLSNEVKPLSCGTLLHEGILSAYEAGIDQLKQNKKVRLLVQSEKAPEKGRTEARTALFETDAETFLTDRSLRDEVFGPAGLLVKCQNAEQMTSVAQAIEGSLTGTVHGRESELKEFASLLNHLERSVGRLVFNGFPTGVEVCSSMVHGGPFPATTDSRFTSVGGTAIVRFTRPVCYQDYPQSVLPIELRDANEKGIWRWVNNQLTREAIKA